LEKAKKKEPNRNYGIIILPGALIGAISSVITITNRRERKPTTNKLSPRKTGPGPRSLNEEEGKKVNKQIRNYKQNSTLYSLTNLRGGKGVTPKSTEGMGGGPTSKLRPDANWRSDHISEFQKDAYYTPRKAKRRNLQRKKENKRRGLFLGDKDSETSSTWSLISVIQRLGRGKRGTFQRNRGLWTIRTGEEKIRSPEEGGDLNDPGCGTPPAKSSKR